MSIELHVFLSRRRLPNVHAWQAAIDSLGFDVKLDLGTNVGTKSGFLPAVIKGRESGFEFDVTAAFDITEGYSEIEDRVAGLDLAANFRWSGDADEMACALVASAAMAALSDGVWFDPQDVECLDAAGAMKVAQDGMMAADEAAD